MVYCIPFFGYMWQLGWLRYCISCKPKMDLKQTTKHFIHSTFYEQVPTPKKAQDSSCNNRSQSTLSYLWNFRSGYKRQCRSDVRTTKSEPYDLFDKQSGCDKLDSMYMLLYTTSPAQLTLYLNHYSHQFAFYVCLKLLNVKPACFVWMLCVTCYAISTARQCSVNFTADSAGLVNTNCVSLTGMIDAQ